MAPEPLNLPGCEKYHKSFLEKFGTPADQKFKWVITSKHGRAPAPRRFSRTLNRRLDFDLNSELALPMLYRGYDAQTTNDDTAPTVAAQRIIQVALA